MLAAYLYEWRKSVKRQPLLTMRGTMKHVRRSWVAAHLGTGMLPVNTLRDVIRSSQWFASNALLVAVGACGFLASGGNVAYSDILQLKIIFLIASCGLTFIFFMHSARFYTHASFLINTPDIAGAPVTEEIVYRMMARAADMFSNGQKCSTGVALPALLWILGPAYLVLSTVLVIYVMRQLDFEDLFSARGATAGEERDGVAGAGTSTSTTTEMITVPPV